MVRSPYQLYLSFKAKSEQGCKDYYLVIALFNIYKVTLKKTIRKHFTQSNI